MKASVLGLSASITTRSLFTLILQNVSQHHDFNKMCAVRVYTNRSTCHCCCDFFLKHSLRSVISSYPGQDLVWRLLRPWSYL